MESLQPEVLPSQVAVLLEEMLYQVMRGRARPVQSIATVLHFS
jgi:hypothetical protein